MRRVVDVADRSPVDVLRTEFDFVLPRGYLDKSGVLHREGTMRLATARDELLPLHDERVRENSAYLSVVLLAVCVAVLALLRERWLGVG